MAEIPDERLSWELFRDLFLDTGDPRWLAQKILRGFNIRRPPVQVRVLAQNMGIRLTPIRNPGYWGGADSHLGAIAHASGQPLWEDFTIAYLLGQLLMQDEEGMVRNRVDDPVQSEEKAFAYELLMPTTWIQIYAPLAGYRPKPLAREFQVNEKFMVDRLNKLARTGLLGER